MVLNDKLSVGKVLPLMESFHSLQGEGYHSGLPAYFIRLGGCDMLLPKSSLVKNIPSLIDQLL